MSRDLPFITPEEEGLDDVSREPYRVTNVSRIAAESLAACIVPFDSDDDVRRMAEKQGIPYDDELIAEARRIAAGSVLTPEEQAQGAREWRESQRSARVIALRAADRHECGEDEE